MQNLIICSTPLHVLIAEKIIEIYSKEKFVGVFLTTTRNDITPQINTYINKLRSITEEFYHFHIKNPRHIGGITSLILLNNEFSKRIYYRSYDKFFVSHIHSEATYYLIERIKFRRLMTYDDGYANINRGGVYFKEDLTLKKRVIRHLFRIKNDLYSIKKLSNKHFTIYNAPNAVSNTQFIKLINIETPYNKVTRNISIFIGQPLHTIDKRFDNDFINNLLEKLNVNYYLPHPGENYIINPNIVEVLILDVIAEEYIVNLVAKGYNIIVYGFYSSVLANLSNIKNVRTVAITTPSLKSAFNREYDNLRTLNIELQNI